MSVCGGLAVEAAVSADGWSWDSSVGDDMCLVDAAMAERCCGWLVGMLEGWMYAMSCCGRMKRCGGCLWKGLSQMLERSYFLEDLPPSYRHVLKNSAVVMS